MPLFRLQRVCQRSMLTTMMLPALPWKLLMQLAEACTRQKRLSGTNTNMMLLQRSRLLRTHVQLLAEGLQAAVLEAAGQRLPFRHKLGTQPLLLLRSLSGLLVMIMIMAHIACSRLHQLLH